MGLVARKEEQKLLNQALCKQESQLIAVYGRRGVGKTYLIRELFSERFSFIHTGYFSLPRKEQLSGFWKSLRKAGLSPTHSCPKNWMEAFELLEIIVEQSEAEKKILFMDELSWMDTPRCDLIPALEHFWNAFASARKDVILLICSSATSWVINHVIHNKGGLHNRLTLSIHLEPFKLCEVEEYVHSLGVSLNRMQILEGYMSLGGVPYYWSHLEKGMSIDQYIDFLFFRRGALLKDEYSYLFGSLFKQPEIYEKIVRFLYQKKKGMTRNEILKATGLTSAGGTTQMLRELENCDFIREYTSYGDRKERIYQLIDPFILFHCHFLEPRPGDTQFWMHRVNTPAVNSWKGLAFELVCLLHTQKIKDALGIGSVLTEEFSFTVRENLEEGIHGSQIDLVLVRADRITNLIEIKFSQDEYLISKASEEAMRRKRSDYQRASGSKNTIHLTMIAPYGVIQNSYANNLDSVVTGEDLFR